MYLRKLKNNKSFYVSGGFGRGQYEEKEYLISKENNIVSCECMAYKTCKYPKEQKFCKHILAYVDPKFFGSNVPSELINKTKVL